MLWQDQWPGLTTWALCYGEVARSQALAREASLALERSDTDHLPRLPSKDS